MTRSRRFAVAFASAALLTAGTGSEKSKPLVKPDPEPAKVEVPEQPHQVLGSCLAADRKSCTEYEGASLAGDPKAACAKAKGTWADQGCPADGRVATCIQRATGSDDRTLTRSYAPMTPQQAQAACKKVARSAFLAR
ncbi:MAG TPA: hypothetical protein VLU43_13735 [Anaeromyxobacteraceae bacterium]|nr:hypothetical protein [Anaeromyxobacteraceae bacterium]